MLEFDLNFGRPSQLDLLDPTVQQIAKNPVLGLQCVQQDYWMA